MEDVIPSKSTSVISKTNSNARFKETMQNMESPVIIRRVGRNDNFHDVRNRVALQTARNVSNFDSYDIMYNNHKDYYNDKKYFVFDNNFEKMEDYLLGEFSDSISANIVPNKNLVHVDDYKTTMNGEGFQVPNIPRDVNKYQVYNTRQSRQYGFNHPSTKVYANDPYQTMFPDHRK